MFANREDRFIFSIQREITFRSTLLCEKELRTYNPSKYLSGFAGFICLGSLDRYL
jgi:hypothetical protein